tara:strand:- start:43 stop:423 length:381 start_codon:yes stop_codon:yes gene_type:complete
MMMNKYKGETKGTLANKEYVFRLTFESIVSIEDRTNKSIMQIATEMGNNNFAMRDIVIVLYEALKGADNKIVQKAVGDLVIQNGLVNSAVLASQILTTIFMGEKKEDNDPLVEAENKEQNTPSKNT